MDNEKFGKLIIQLRKENNMTQKDLADKLHITDKAISKWERGISFPDVSMLKPISEIFNISIIELLNGERDNSKEVINEAIVDERVFKVLKQVEQEKNRKIKKVILVFCITLVIILLTLGICIISKVKLYTYNPVNALIGYIKIEMFDKEYVEVEKNPNKLIYAKEEFNFSKYMSGRGFKEIKEERLGYARVFTDGNIKEYITCWNVIDGYPFNIYEWTNTTKYIEEKEKFKFNELKDETIEETPFPKINGIVDEVENEDMIIIQ